MGKRTAQKFAIKDISSDSQVNSHFPYRWSPASLTINIYFYLPVYLYITRISINNGTSHLKSPKNQIRRAALGRPAIKSLGGGGGGLEPVCGRLTFALAKPAIFFANFPVNKHPPTSEVICPCRSTYEGCDLVPLVTSSIGDSQLVVHLQEAYARLFSNCYNKQDIQSNFLSYRPMNQGTICAKAYPEGVQTIKGNNCGLIPIYTYPHL